MAYNLSSFVEIGGEFSCADIQTLIPGWVAACLDIGSKTVDGIIYKYNRVIYISKF